MQSMTLEQVGKYVSLITDRDDFVEWLENQNARPVWKVEPVKIPENAIRVWDLENGRIPGWLFDDMIVYDEEPDCVVSIQPKVGRFVPIEPEWKEIENSKIRHVWADSEGEEIEVDPTFYTDSGTPIDGETGEDLEYVRTETLVQE